ncbi:RNA ligase RtcB family protein [Tahibacter amnicola]|uniref:3'-phosphate/5'-hydroxy nucleic acid ligase n=1 Tax=Tahibacter amnicola TaxID=2976241 RepID=A0ABY6BIY1_9GAMM|nr:RNA ligase RtcB family protein [Tahibacter amnicola]UXI69964.1 RNA ligase RtcB family protein [Tahibacter amnicola]
MGNSPIRTVSEGVHVIASDDTWIEGRAIQQLEITARLAGMHTVVGMPDLHPGRGYPVGAAFFSVGHLYPALVGNDIGCGMALWQTRLPVRQPADKLEKQLGSIDGPLGEDWQEAVADAGFSHTGHERALGTIGGGNHFAELQRLDTCHDSDALARHGINAEQLQLLVHSGSRGLGESILRRHVDRFGHAGLVDGSAEAEDYLGQHDEALRFAVCNRQLIARRMLARWKTGGHLLVDVSHNLVSRHRHGEREGWLHRKGATPAQGTLLAIPGSRGDYTYLVEPVPNAASLESLAHGAGRKWVRSDCKDRLRKRYTVEQLQRPRLGGRVICDDRELIYEEAPEAYKPVDSIIRDLVDAGLIRLVARLTPVLTYKTRARCCE